MSDFQNLNNGMGSNVNPFDYKSEVCEECGNIVFQPALIFKKVPGILLGQGSEEVSLPIKVTCCSKCGALSPHDKAFVEEQEKTQQQTQNIII